ncbi:hypothetical protein AAFP35_04950 [Gordonia sp. CPCC 206044]|uniref:ESX secretion-associated protein EspG n=1 Tax=Gordonia sp. CPCC 206044 TaxID=3140793 RepID=UPI003AF334A6
MTAQEVSVFADLWGQAWMPYPLLSRPGSISDEALDRLHASIRDRIDKDPPRVLEEWARTSILPDLRVEALVSDPDRERNRDNKCMRINAVRRNDFGFVAVQHTDDTDAPSGDISVFSMEAVDLGAAIVAALPALKVTKSRGDVRLPSHRPSESRSNSLYDAGSDVDPVNDSSPLGEAVSAGFLQVREGRDAERRLERTAPRLVWSDYPEYGRYVFAGGVLKSVDSAGMQNCVNGMIGRMVSVIRERRGG